MLDSLHMGKPSSSGLALPLLNTDTWNSMKSLLLSIKHPISNSATTFQYRHLKQYEESATVHQHPISNSAASYTEMPKLDGVTRDTGQAHMAIYNSFIHHATQKAVAHKDKRLLELWHWSSLCTKTATESEKWLPESSHQFHSSTTVISQQSLPSAGELNSEVHSAVDQRDERCLASLHNHSTHTMGCTLAKHPAGAQTAALMLQLKARSTTRRSLRSQTWSLAMNWHSTGHTH